MSGVTITLRRVRDNTLPYLETLLEENRLPTQDVRTKRDSFYIAHSGADPVGVGGFETYGTDGLLRSVVIEESAQGQGFGTALCDSLESAASTDGVETLYLLTTTAADFFANLGYKQIDRAEAPDSIRQTTEFDHHCPTEATCMKKSLS